MHRALSSPLFLLLALLCAGSGRATGTEATGIPLTQEAFVAALAQNFTNHYGLEGELQIELLRAWTAPVQPAREWTLEVTEYPSGMASAMLTRCRVLADGQPAGEYTITLHAMLWRDAWAVRQPVTANGTFNPALLEVRRVDLLRDRDSVPVAVGDHDYIFARTVQPGRLLTWRDIARRPLVRKGDYVEVAAVEGMLQITMRGLAMENGAQGDSVTIRNPDSRKDFTALVVAENRVEIHF